MDILEKTLAYIAEKTLFLPADRLLVAVSGGCDSVVLLDILVRLGYSVGVAHCNFQLRGEESNGDKAFVQALAKSYNVPLYCVRFETKEYAEKNNVSIQIAARELRYSWFSELLSKEKYNYLTTAHHLNDNIETILHRLVRGTGIIGLQGIPAQNDKIVRPLLNIPQADIKQHALENGLAWREDSSNAQDKYTRNFLRHKVVPRLKELNPSLEDTFTHTLERLQGYASHFQASLAQLQASLIRHANQATYIQFEPLLAQVAGKIFLAEMLVSYKFHYEQTQQIWEKTNQKAIGTLFLSPTHSLVIDREAIVITERKPQKTNIFYLEKGQASLETADFSLAYAGQARADLPTDGQNILLDEQTLTFPLVFRRWQAGDSFRPLGMQGKRKKISDFLNDCKVPRNLKPNVWVLCSGEDIVWVMGYRMAHDFRLTEKTTAIACLQVRFFS